MAVDDASLWRVHGGDAGELGLETFRRRGIDDLDAFDAVELCLLVNAGEPLALALVGGDDELAAFAMGYAVGGAKGVKEPPPARAVTRPQRAGRVVEPGVNDFAVARGHTVADAGGRFRDHHLVPGCGGRARDRKPQHARSDHKDLHLLCPA
jgi:hypothetical protein